MLEFKVSRPTSRRSTVHFLAGFVALLFLSPLLLRAAQPAVVSVVQDLLETFPSARVQDTAEATVRRPVSAGGREQPALFEHPKEGGRPAQVNYEIALPKIGPNDLLLLAFQVGLADGIEFGQGEDGVRFRVEIEGRPQFSRVWTTNRWERHGLDLGPFAGQKIALSLLVDALGNTRYDWAVWGSPRILLFRGALLAPTNPISLPSSKGVLATKAFPGTRFQLRARGRNESLEWTQGSSLPNRTEPCWSVQDFDFTGAEGVELDWDPRQGSKEILSGSYQPQLVLTCVSAGRAVISTSDSVPVRVEVMNTGRGELPAGQATIGLQTPTELLPVKPVPSLAPGQSWETKWTWVAPARPERMQLRARLDWSGQTAQTQTTFQVFGTPLEKSVVQNDFLKLEFNRFEDGYAFARIFSRQENGWAEVGVWSPLFRLSADLRDAVNSWTIQPERFEIERNAGQEQTAKVTAAARDGDGVEWQVQLGVTLPAHRPLARIHYEWKSGADRSIRSLWGPNIYVGDGGLGQAKSWGLFPGLEYLYGPERSSNPRDFSPELADRRTPDSRKITIPLEAVTLGPNSQDPPDSPERFYAPDSLKDIASIRNGTNSLERIGIKQATTVGLFWVPLQRWDGRHAFPSARYSSPNLDEGMANHRLGLFLPSAPDCVPENGNQAAPPYHLEAGKAVTLDATLTVCQGTVTAAIRTWLDEVGGLPKPNPPPRSFASELDVCRAGLLQTLWSPDDQGWRHCIGWPAQQAPGFAALLWMDAHVAKNPEARRASAQRLNLAAENMLQSGGPASFTSPANCHIMQWEFPFLYGYLPEAISGLDGLIHHLIQSQRPDGGWVYQPGNKKQASLGQAGDSVLGTCAHQAATLLRYARITGDPIALAAGEKALRFMEQFRVPRGGQTWECPMYEPDILAAAYAIRAYHDGYRATGNPRWLHDAVYWAEAGVPFIYLWSMPDKPMMLGATIPVFGSTFYTHTWLAVPVQWCGLVYAYHVFHLAEELEKATLPPTDSPLPLALEFQPADWRRIVELITVSGMYQQFSEGPRIGAYPDSISRFETRNPAFINPEDILVNVLALHGYDPDVKTVRLERGAKSIFISSGAAIQRARAGKDSLELDLKFFPGASSHTLVAGFNPRRIEINGTSLPPSSTPTRREPGWWRDASRDRIYLTVPHAEAVSRIRLLEQPATVR
jgi:hypothetical protein